MIGRSFHACKCSPPALIPVSMIAAPRMSSSMASARGISAGPISASDPVSSPLVLTSAMTLTSGEHRAAGRLAIQFRRL